MMHFVSRQSLYTEFQLNRGLRVKMWYWYTWCTRPMTLLNNELTPTLCHQWCTPIKYNAVVQKPTLLTCSTLHSSTHAQSTLSEGIFMSPSVSVTVLLHSVYVTFLCYDQCHPPGPTVWPSFTKPLSQSPHWQHFDIQIMSVRTGTQ